MAASIYKHFVGSPTKAKQSIGSFPRVTFRTL